MKKLLKTFVCLMTFLSISSVDAATLSIGNDTTTAGALNKSVTLELLDDKDNPNLKDFVKLEFELNVSGTAYAEISFSYSGSGMTYTPDGNKYTIESSTGLYESTLGTISYKTTEDLDTNFQIKPVNVKFIKADGTEMKPGDQGVSIKEGSIKYEKPKSTEATLTSLTVSQGELSPAFSSDITEYTVQVKDTISIIKILADPCTGATRTGTGNKNLNMGENMFEVEVTAEDGTTKKTYYVNVVRGEITEPSAYIEDLVINNIGVELDSEFDPQNNKYTVKVGPNISKLDFDIELQDPLAEVTIEGNEDLVPGENTILIKVVSSDGNDEQTYEITVTKEEEESTEAPIVDNDDKDKKDEEKGDKTWLIVLIVVVIVLIVGGVAFLLFRKKKPKKDDIKLPLKKREHDEPTVSEEDRLELQKREEDNSITDILKGELFDDDRTQRFDSKSFKEDSIDYDDEDDIDKTKEFNFKNFE